MLHKNKVCQCMLISMCMVWIIRHCVIFMYGGQPLLPRALRTWRLLCIVVTAIALCVNNLNCMHACRIAFKITRVYYHSETSKKSNPSFILLINSCFFLVNWLIRTPTNSIRRVGPIQCWWATGPLAHMSLQAKRPTILTYIQYRTR